AATAAIALLIEQSFTILAQNNPISAYTQVGLLGIVIFVTSTVTNLLALSASKSQKIVQNQAQLLATSQQLNAHIVSAMHAGVIVLDNHYQIRLINQAAKQLLGLELSITPIDMIALPAPFRESVANFKSHAKQFVPQQMTNAGPLVRLAFHPLGKPLPMGLLVFIFNASEEARQAQDLKLASLGHLTANIAHELRNPLGAASHAAQLIAESSHLTGEDAHLIKMIKDSCDRMNTVIQNVLSLSGRSSAKTQEIELISWLKQFIKELVVPNILQPNVTLEYNSENINICVDPSQLTQILIILCENGLRYSLRKTGFPILTLRVLASDKSDIHIDIIDKGEGIEANAMKHIFEPFFTTESSGTGLGLYIAKELSEMNGVRLSHIPIQEGCQFRITVPYQETTWHNQPH
ncbi:MAG: PAS domain-containing sensor histidine kinase, partial [Candidatus Berkiella sp.]